MHGNVRIILRINRINAGVITQGTTTVVLPALPHFHQGLQWRHRVVSLASALLACAPRRSPPFPCPQTAVTRKLTCQPSTRMYVRNEVALATASPLLQ